MAQKTDGSRHQCDLNQAATEARGGLERFPGSPSLHMALGRVLVLQHQLDAAFKEFSRAHELDPSQEKPLAWQIATLSIQRRYEEAIARGEAALTRFPKSAYVRVALGRVYLDWSRPQDALRYLAEASRRAPGNETVSSWLAACRAAMFQWKEAESIVREAIAWHPGSVKMLYRLGRILVDDHRDLEALACFEKAFELDSEHARVLEWRITALRALNRFEEAEDEAIKAIDLFRQSAWLHVELGWVYCDQGKYEQACAQVEEALRIDGLNSWAQRSKIDFLRLKRDLTAAQDAADRALEQNPYDPRLATAAACVYVDQERHEDAMRAVEEALSRDPLNSWALRSRVDFLRRANRFHEAELAAARAIEARADDPRIYTTAAWVSSSMGRYSEALDRVGEALRIDPTNCWALSSHIDFLRQARRLREAEHAAEEALRQRKTDPDLYVAAAWVYSAQDREDKASAKLAAALKIDETNPAARSAQLYFLRWARQFEKAKAAADAAVAARPDDLDVLTAAGWVYSDVDAHDRALKLVGRALRRDPKDSWALSCRINFLRAANRYDDAEQKAEEALRKCPDDPLLHTVAGFLHGDRNHYAKALEHFEKALARNPWHLEALEWKSATLRSMLLFQDALEAAGSACELRPEDPSLRVELARVHDVRLQFDDALRLLAQVLELDPGNVPALIAQSSAFRAVRSYEQAERVIGQRAGQLPGNRELQTELGWIMFDQRLSAEAARVFQKLLETSANDAERAAAYYGLGWSCFAEDAFGTAQAHFAEAVKKWPEDANYQLGRAWSLAGQPQQHWKDAEELAYTVAETRPDPFAHACLGLVAFRRRSYGAAEYHLKKTLELDAYQGSYTDLGALYVQAGRYSEAEDNLRHAIERDWYDAVAHTELGCLFLLRDDDHLKDAQHEFRQALVTDPASVRANVGLALALSRDGRDAEAENTLRRALTRTEIDRRSDHWRLHDTLAWLLLRRGTEQQRDTGLLDDAYHEARQAIHLAESEPEPYFMAGLVQYWRASHTLQPLERARLVHQARKSFRECLQRDNDNAEAKRYEDLLSRERRWIRPGSFGGIALALLSVTLLTVILIVFLVTRKFSATQLSVNIPILVGIFTISTLLPALTRLKMPGFEADLQPQARQEPSGPTGEDSFSPGRLTVPTGPTGQVPRRGQARLAMAKSTKHV